MNSNKSENKEDKIKRILQKANNIRNEDDIQAINRMFQEGITVDDLLKEIDSGNYSDLIHHKGLENLSDLILVHKTDYVPENGIIKTSGNAGVVEKKTETILGKNYNYEVHSHRDTVHFVVNGEVTSHAAGNFDGRKYAILLPAEKANITNACSVDTFLTGNVEVPIGGFILCPEREVQEISKKTKNLVVIGYEGKSVDNYANLFLEKVLGYKLEEIGSLLWGNEDDEKKFVNICNKNNLRQGGPHGGTTEMKQETAKTVTDTFCSLFSVMKDNVDDKKTYNAMKERLKMILVVSNWDEKPIQSLLDSKIMPKNYFFDQIETRLGIKFPDEEIKKYYCEYEKPEKKRKQFLESKTIEYCKRNGMNPDDVNNEKKRKQFFESRRIEYSKKYGVNLDDVLNSEEERIEYDVDCEISIQQGHVVAKLTDYVVDYVMTEGILQTKSELSMRELLSSEGIYPIAFKEAFKSLSEKGLSPKGCTMDSKVGEYFDSFHKSEKEITSEDLRKNSEGISAKERRDEIGKMKNIGYANKERESGKNQEVQNDDDITL